MEANIILNQSILAKKCMLAEINLRNALKKYNKANNKVHKQKTTLFDLPKCVLQYIFNKLNNVSQCILLRVSRHFKHLIIYSMKINVYKDIYAVNKFVRKLYIDKLPDSSNLSQFKYLEKLTIIHETKNCILPLNLTNIRLESWKTDIVEFSQFSKLEILFTDGDVKSLPNSIKNLNADRVYGDKLPVSLEKLYTGSIANKDISYLTNLKDLKIGNCHKKILPKNITTLILRSYEPCKINLLKFKLTHLLLDQISYNSLSTCKNTLIYLSLSDISGVCDLFELIILETLILDDMTCINLPQSLLNLDIKNSNVGSLAHLHNLEYLKVDKKSIWSDVPIITKILNF